MKLIKRFLSGGGLTTAQGLASVFQGVNLQQGLSGDARLGNMQVKDGMFNPAPPLYAPMILTLQNNLLWQTNKLTTIPEENTALPKSNIQVALEGEKLQPNRFMDFIKRFFMGPPVEHKPYVQRPLPRNTYKIKEPLEPDVKSDMNTYSGGMLPGITVEAKDLSKPQRFPYGGINVISKPINGGLDTRQRVIVNPLESSDLMAKYGDGDKLPTAQNAKERYKNGTRRSNSFKEFGDSISIRGVEGASPWYKKSPVILEYIRHDNRGNDMNDTIYAERPAYFPLVNEEVRAASNSKYLGKRNAVWTKLFGFINGRESTPEGVSNYDTLQRRFNTAWGVAKHQTGGPVERVDNTSVTSKPLLVKNKIPYGAGKGPAADGPMRLFNDPYVGIGMMAMVPIASRGFSSTKPASVNKFSTYIKGLPKSMSTSNKVAIGAGTVGGVALGYDDNHNQYVREGLRKMGIEFPLGLNPKGDSIYNDRHIFDNLLKYMLEYK